MNLFRRRKISDLQAEVLQDHSLRRALGPLNLTTLGIGAVIGAGIFVLTGQAAAKYAGPAIVYSFILAGIACGLAGLSSFPPAPLHCREPLRGRYRFVPTVKNWRDRMKPAASRRWPRDFVRPRRQQ